MSTYYPTGLPSLASTFFPSQISHTYNHKPEGSVSILALGVLLGFSCLLCAAWCIRFNIADRRTREVWRLSNPLPSLPRFKKGYDKSMDDSHSELGVSSARSALSVSQVSASNQRLLATSVNSGSTATSHLSNGQVPL